MSEVKVPKGYKQTEVGVIPEDWEVVSLGDIGDCIIGLTYSPSDVSSFGTLVLRSSNVQNGHLAYKNNVYVDMNLPERVIVNKGDILICVRNGSRKLIGKCALIDEKSEGHAFGAFMSVFRTKLYPFIFYQFQSNLIQNQIQENMGATINQITNKDLKSFKVMLPKDIKEQTAIANALTDTDNIIQSLEKLIAKKEAIKTGTMQQLLTGKTRLPEFATREDGSPKRFKQTELGKIPEDWDVVTIRESCDLLTGHPFSSSKYSDSGVRLLRGSNIKRGNTDWDSSITRYWPEITSNISHYALNIGDVVISMDGSLVGRSFAQLSESDLPALLLQRVARLRAKTIDQNYLKEWVCSSIFTEHCDLVKTVTAIPHISPADILNFKIATPRNGNEQTAIASILSDMDAEIEAVQDRLEKTKAIKQGMMQQLLTGKVRLV